LGDGSAGHLVSHRAQLLAAIPENELATMLDSMEVVDALFPGWPPEVEEGEAWRGDEPEPQEEDEP